jgi:hypothetical protein
MVLLGAVCLAGLGALGAAGKKVTPQPAPEVVMQVAAENVMQVAAENKRDRLSVSSAQSTLTNPDAGNVESSLPSDTQATLVQSVPEPIAGTTPAHEHETAQESTEITGHGRPSRSEVSAERATQTGSHRHDPAAHKIKHRIARRAVTKHAKKPPDTEQPKQVRQITECRSDGFHPFLRTLNLVPPCEG